MSVDATLRFVRSSGVVKGQLRIGGDISVDFTESSCEKAINFLRQEKLNSLGIVFNATARCRSDRHVLCRIVRRFLENLDCHACLSGFGGFSPECCTEILSCEFPKFVEIFDISKDTQTRFCEFFPMFLEKQVGCGKITQLTLVSCESNRRSIRDAITTHLSRKTCKLESLTLGLNDTEEEENYLSSESLLLALAATNLPNTLKVLKISGAYKQPITFFDRLVEKLMHCGINLCKLSFVNVKFDTASLEALQKYINVENSALKTLKLKNVKFKSLMDMELLTQAVTVNSTIQKLNLQGALDDLENTEIAQSWHQCLCNNTAIETVDFTFNKSDVFANDYFATLLSRNNHLKHVYIDYTISQRHITPLLNVLNSIYNIVALSKSSAMIDARFGQLLARNRSLVWQQSLHQKVLEYCLAMASLQLPPYVLLWIFEWLPLMHLVSHHKVIRLIETVVKSIVRVDDKRSLGRVQKKKRY